MELNNNNINMNAQGKGYIKGLIKKASYKWRELINSCTVKDVLCLDGITWILINYCLECLGLNLNTCTHIYRGYGMA